MDELDYLTDFLKTPLTVLGLKLQLLEDETDPDAKAGRMINNLRLRPRGALQGAQRDGAADLGGGTAGRREGGGTMNGEKPTRAPVPRPAETHTDGGRSAETSI